jgi:hypothetical protein
MTTKIENVTRKVALLLERANHASTPEHEANACRAKADKLIFDYQIEAAMVAEAQPQQDQPIWSEILLCRADSEWSAFYAHLVRSIARHVGVQGIVHSNARDDDGFRWYAFDAVGFPADLEMMQLLWTSTAMEFGRLFEPKYDPSLSDAVNAFQMRMGGMERRRIAAVMFPGWETVNEMKAKTRKVTALIKKGAEELGEDATTVLGRGGASIKTHRLSYANGFVHTLDYRMSALRIERGRDDRGLVLVSRGERVKEALYTKYEYMRPQPRSTKAIGEEQATCDKCRNAKSGYCREHSWMKPSTAQHKGPRLSYDAYNRGKSAASRVDLGPGGRGSLPSSPHKRLG